MPRVLLDFDPPKRDAPGFTADTSDLVYFLSWAYATRYGASHELSHAARTLRNLGIDLQPLLTFADRNAEDPADEEALDLAWQDAAPLSECCAAVARAIADSHEEGLDLREYPGLRLAIEELGQIAAWAVSAAARIRVTYEIEEEA
jgi:hypothetical protein